MTRMADRTLDQIVTENALLWLRRRIAARKVERKPYHLLTLAEEMRPFLVEEKAERAPNMTEIGEVDHVARTVSRYLGLSRRDKRTWSLDYLEAFCHAIGIPVAELFVPTPKLDERERIYIEELTDDAKWAQPPDRKSRRGA